MPNTLDLQKKPQPVIRIVEKVVIKKRVWWVELLQTLAVLAAVVVVTWSISHAEIFTGDTNKNAATVSSSKIASPRWDATGIVSSVSDSSLSISEALSAQSKDTSFVFEITDAKIFDRRRESISASEVKVGDKVTVQGVISKGKIRVERVYDFAVGSVEFLVEEKQEEVVEEVQEETATTTDQIVVEDVATSTQGSVTDENATSTQESITGENATSTEGADLDVLNASTTSPTNTIDVPENTFASSTSSEFPSDANSNSSASSTVTENPQDAPTEVLPVPPAPPEPDSIPVPLDQ